MIAEERNLRSWVTVLSWCVEKGFGESPCTDDPSLSANGTCSADRGHCQQYTDAGADMDRDCPETCGIIYYIIFLNFLILT